ncbi:unnamed protein product, partial [Amoebophrya sp. A120]|eukprot:GSA120T00002041001.1
MDAQLQSRIAATTPTKTGPATSSDFQIQRALAFLANQKNQELPHPKPKAEQEQILARLRENARAERLPPERSRDAEFEDKLRRMHAKETSDQDYEHAKKEADSWVSAYCKNLLHQQKHHAEQRTTNEDTATSAPTTVQGMMSSLLEQKKASTKTLPELRKDTAKTAKLCEEQVTEYHKS